MGFGWFGEQRRGRGRQQPLSAVFNKNNSFQRGGLISVFMKLGEGGGLKIDHLSLFVSALGHGRNDSHVGFILSLFPAGELEKQQGTKAPSLKSNSAQLELRGRQGSPAGVCVQTCCG